MDKNSAPLKLYNDDINCMLYADDLILFSESHLGLQNSLNILADYSSKWGLTVNMSKTKVIVFNKAGKIYKNEILTFNSQKLGVVKSYLYLGIIFKASGSFTDAIDSLKDKGMKAMHSVMKHTWALKPNLCLKVFNCLVRPIITYGCEIWTSNHLTKLNLDNLFTLCDKPSTERVNLKFAKHILGVHNKSSNAAVRGELGLFPTLIHQCKLLIRYLIRLQNTGENSLVAKAYNECKVLQHSQTANWLQGVGKLLSLFGLSYINDIDIPSLNLICTNLNNMYINQWSKILNKHTHFTPQSNKLELYCQFKKSYELEKYLLNVKNRQYRVALTKLRISAHSLHIETGRYHKPMKTPVNDRICLHCDLGIIENEEHFLLSCTKYDALRNKMINEILEVLPTFLLLANKDKVLLMLDCYKGDMEISNIVSKCVYAAFESCYI